jgi:hypothetical protein
MKVPNTMNGLHSDTNEWLSRVNANGGILDPDDVYETDKFVRKSYKYDIRKYLKRLNFFIGENIESVSVPLFNDGFDVDNFYNYESGNYDKNIGIKGHNDFYLDTGFFRDDSIYDGSIEYPIGFGFVADEINTGSVILGYQEDSDSRSFLMYNPFSTGDRIGINTILLNPSPLVSEIDIIITAYRKNNKNNFVSDKGNGSFNYPQYFGTSPRSIFVFAWNYRGEEYRLNTESIIKSYWITLDIPDDSTAIKINELITEYLTNINRL